MEPKHHKLVRLILEGRLSKTKVSEICGRSRNTVISWQKRLAEHGQEWDHYQDLSETDLLATLFPKRAKRTYGFFEPDWDELRKERSLKATTVEGLYEEYVENAPEDAKLMSCSSFYGRMRPPPDRRDVVMFNEYEPGEQVQFDFVGSRPPLLEDEFGKNIPYEIGVAASSNSHYTFATTMRSQSTADSIQFLTEMLIFFGGVPATLVVDNFKGAVITPRRGNKQAMINLRYQACTDHYRMSVVPTRPGRPRDKAIGENAVLQVKRRVLQRLRKQRFRSLAELNAAIRPLMEELNNRPMKSRGNISRKALFEESDFGGFSSLPKDHYVDGVWEYNRTIRPNLTFAVEGNFYSVPPELVHEKVNVKMTPASVFAYHEYKQVAVHERLHGKGQVSFRDYHRPEEHQFHRQTLVEQACKLVQHVGPDAVKFIRLHAKRNRHSPPPNVAAWEIAEISKEFGLTLANEGCRMSNNLETTSVVRLRKIVAGLARGAADDTPDRQCGDEPSKNVRGAEYFNRKLKKGGGSDV